MIAKRLYFNMLYLIASEVDVKNILNVNCKKFSESIFIGLVPHYKLMFDMDGCDVPIRDVCLFVIVSWDVHFLVKLKTLCDFKCIISQYENANTVSLYRVVGTEEREYYEKMLRGVEYKFIDDIVVKCRNCGHCGQCDDLGNGLLWIDWDSELWKRRKSSEVIKGFYIHFDHVFFYNFFDNDHHRKIISL